MVASFDASDNMVLVAGQFGVTGTLTVSDDGSEFDARTLAVGDGGIGMTTISYGGAISVGANLIIGYGLYTSGTLTVADASSSLDVGGDLTDGDFGQGLLAVGGDTTISGDADIGASSYGSGQITVNGAALELDGKTTAGDSRSGTILVQLAGTLTAHDVTLGVQSGSSGTLTVDGDGTGATTEGLTVGSAGQAMLSVTNGAQLVSTADSTLGDAAVAKVQSRPSTQKPRGTSRGVA